MSKSSPRSSKSTGIKASSIHPPPSAPTVAGGRVQEPELVPFWEPTDAELAQLERELFNFGIEDYDEGSPTETDGGLSREREQFSPVDDGPKPPLFACPMAHCSIKTVCAPRAVDFDRTKRLLVFCDSGELAGDDDCFFLKHVVSAHGNYLIQSLTPGIRQKKSFHCPFSDCRAKPSAGSADASTFRTKSNLIEHLFSGGHHEDLHFYCKQCLNTTTRESVFFKTFRTAKNHFQNKHGCAFAARNGSNSRATVVAKLDGDQPAVPRPPSPSVPSKSSSPNAKRAGSRPTSSGRTAVSSNTVKQESTETLLSSKPASPIPGPVAVGNGSMASLTSQLEHLVMAGADTVPAEERARLQQLLKLATEVVGKEM
ncbi:hypothetical protein HDU93_007448 [Gonapodya sp. JEL0774]|nr:hypothetical protein HDU93_007448 [Gonapodya sp. JEL0774]